MRVMFARHPGTIEDFIFQYLQTGAMSTPALVDAIQSVRPRTTKQGVYAALRNLKRDEIVLTNDKQARLNVRWLKKMEEYFAVAQKAYFEGTLGRGNFYNLGIGEKVEYTFRNPTQADAFWWQALYLLSEMSNTKEPVYLYNPHDWFLLARRESERESIESIIGRGKRYLLTVGGKNPLDRAVADEFDGNKSQYHMALKPLFQKNNYYLNVVDDFLIQVWIGKKLADAIDVLYRGTTKVDGQAEKRINDLVRQKGRVRLVISRDPKKTQRLKKLLGKNFYIPRT